LENIFHDKQNLTTIINIEQIGCRSFSYVNEDFWNGVGLIVGSVLLLIITLKLILNAPYTTFYKFTKIHWMLPFADLHVGLQVW
jgi:hypothetical protein